ncbi:Krueppel like proteinous protein 1 [Ilyonectria robusta]
MKFGLIEADPFDPVQHIDLSQCTVTIDSITTNLAMHNFSADSWESIRSALSEVPLHHPFWRVDPGLGSEVWGAHWDTTITPVPPTPDFDMPLLSLDLWVSGQGPEQHSYAPLECSSCHDKFNHIGLLIRHHRDGQCRVQTNSGRRTRNQRVAASPGEDEDQQEDTEQDKVDAKYWNSTRNCPICDKILSRSKFSPHMEKHALEEQFQCDFPNCGAKFVSQDKLDDHRLIHTSEYRTHYCSYSGCLEAFATSDELVSHLSVHYGNRKHKCDWPDCHKAFDRKENLTRHMRVHSNERPHKCGECGKAFKDAGTLKDHMAIHSGVKFKCTIVGCGKEFSHRPGLANHLATHSNDRKHKCQWPNCDKAFINRAQLLQHEPSHTAEKKERCDFPGCGAMFTQKHSLDSHKARIHKGLNS